MKLNCYCVLNCRSGISTGIWTYRTDAQAVYEISHMLEHSDGKDDMPNDKLFCIGSFDNESRELESFPARELVLDIRVKPTNEVSK